MTVLRNVCVLLLSVSLSVSFLEAQTHGHSHKDYLHFSHPLIAESVSPDTKVRLRYDLASLQDDGTENALSFEGEYAFHPSFSIEVVAPFVARSLDGQPNVSNLDNLEVALKFANFAFAGTACCSAMASNLAYPPVMTSKASAATTLSRLSPF